MKSSDWNSIATHYSRVSDARLVRVFPEAVRLLQKRNCASLLDYGAGDGRFVEAWLEATNGTAVVYDPASEMRRMARSRLSRFGLRARVVASLEEVSSRFDAVTFNAVWMCLQDRAACMSCLHKASALLEDHGIFIASVTHPCFRDRQFSTFRTSFSMENYAIEGSPFQVSMFDGDHAIEFVDYHWSLGEMFRQLHEADFSTTGFIELPDIDDTPWPRSFPWLVLEAKKARLKESG